MEVNPNRGSVEPDNYVSPRKLVETVLHRGHGRRVPFTMYENQIPQCTAERQLRNRGMCIVKRDVNVFKIHHPNVKITQQVYWEQEKQFVRTLYETPKATLSTLDETGGFTVWQHEKMFKSPDDYRAILFLLQDECYEPIYREFSQAQEHFGDDAVFRASFGLEPLQSLISGNIMSTQDFCFQWMDNRDEIVKLYQAIVENRRKIYSLVAQSPVLHANYGGNVTPEIVGVETFEKYYIPHYQEAAEIMHRHGKLTGCHFDANCKLLAKAIASTELDYIEAFTPAPDTDMTLAEARRAWPNKVLWLNFPSSLHLESNEQIAETTVQLLNQAQTIDGLLMGITEDIPEERWRESCAAIMDGLDYHAKAHPDWYTCK